MLVFRSACRFDVEVSAVLQASGYLPVHNMRLGVSDVQKEFLLATSLRDFSSEVVLFSLRESEKIIL